jgi:hypothetical protein
MYNGKLIMDDVTACLLSVERHLTNAAQPIALVGTICWGEQAVLQLIGGTTVCTTHHCPVSKLMK